MIQDKSYPAWPGGEWQTVRLIGHGSFGAVYEIEREVFEHIEKAALKLITIPQSSSDIDELLSDGYDEKSITLRFEGYLKDIVREYSMMVDMKGCANIVYCDDVKYIQHDDGMGWDIFIKMELLTALPKALGKNVSDEQVARIGADICGALAFCEKRSVLHRDIKPQNIFVATDGTYKLGDFGIAKTAERTTSGTKTGTYKYMAPEVYKGLPYGRKADIYSLGLVLYWLLNERRTPFLQLPPVTPTSTDEDNARTRRFNGEPLPPPAHGSEELKRIVLKACAYDPKDRYASAEEMLRDLEELKDKHTTDSPFPPVDIPPNSGQDADLTDDDGSTYGAFGHKHHEQPSKDDAIQRQLHSAYEAACDQEAHAQTASDFYAAAAAFEQSFLQGYLDSAERAGRCRKRAEELRDGNQAPDQQPEKQTGVRKKKWGVIAALAGLAAVAVIALVLWGVFPQITRADPENRGSSLSAHTAVPDQTQSPTSVSTPVPTSEPGVVSTPAQTPDPTPTATDTLPIQPDWTEWSDQLPAYVTAENYDLEERTLYSSRSLETTSSTKSNKMDGWELYDTATGNGAYGAWSDWSQTAASKSDTRDVETETRYRYSDKETTTGSSSTMSGWTLENTTYNWGNWGSWSDWSTTAAVSSDSRDVESETRYRYRDKETTTGSSSTMSGWTLENTTYNWGNWGNWSDWSATAAVSSNSRDVESETRYRYRDRETVSSSADSIPGWTMYDSISSWGDWSNWSSWSTDYVDQTDSTQVETKTQYRYRDISYRTEYSDWGSWSSWGTSAVTSDNYTDVETRTEWRYYYFYCPKCGGREPYQGASDCRNYTLSSSDWHEAWFPISYKDSNWKSYSYTNGKRYTESLGDGQRWNFSSGNLNDTTPGTKDSDSSSAVIRTAYRYRTRSTYQQAQYSDWSSWIDGAISGSSSREVQARTVYRYRTRVKVSTYYFYRWKDWSSWSANAVSGNNDREVQTATFYRYRDRSSVPTYHFTRWKDWSSWSTTAVSQSDTRKVESAMFYRYRDRVKETTYYFRRWTDWSDYSETPVEKSDTTEVQTKKQYRYKSRE